MRNITFLFKLSFVFVLFTCLGVGVALAQIPSITSFTPTSGAVGTPVTITGTNFNPSAPNDVYFGARKVTANANAGGTSITVNVPAGATSITPIVVRNNASGRQRSSMETITGTTVRQFTVTNTPNLTVNASAYVKTNYAVVGSRPGSVAIGDFNGDGNADIAVANSLTDDFSVRIGDGLGGFSGPTNIAVGDNPVKIVTGDFNGDGNADIAVANNTDNDVSIRLGDGLGGFSGTTQISVGTAPLDLAIGDFNGDGRADFATTSTTGNVSIRIGDGTGNFSGTTAIAAGINPQSVALGDFNGDGRADFATANNGAVNIRLGDGLGGFSGTTTVVVAGDARSIAIGDFNGDGRADFATANLSTDNVSIRLGDGTGNFSGTTEVSVGTFPASVAIADFDGDGRADFATTNFNSNDVSIRLGDGLGGFSGTTTIPVSTNPRQLSIGDFNGDGKADFASANFNGDDVTIGLYIETNFYSIANGNWGTAGTWSNTSGGASCGCTPITGGNVFIERGFTVTQTANNQLDNKNITIGTVANATSSGTLDLAGFTNGAITSLTTTATTAAQAGTVRLSAGNALTVTTNTFSTNAFATVDYYGGTFTIPNVFAGLNYPNLIISAGAKSLPNGNFTAASLLLSGGSTLGTASAGTWTLNITGNLQINAGTTFDNGFNHTIINLGGNLVVNGTFTIRPTTTNFNFTGTTPATISGATFPLDFTGAVTLAAGKTVTNNNFNARISGVLNGTDAASTWVQGVGVNFGYSNTTAPMLTGVLDATTNANNTVIYNGGNQTIKNTNYWNITLANVGTKTIAGSPTIAIKGNWLNTPAGINIDPLTSTVVFDGNAAQSISGASTATFSTLVINNPTATVTIGTTVNVNNGLTLTAGRLVLGGNTLTYSGTEGNLTRTAGWIETNGAGTFTRNSIGANFTFPVGSATQYQPLRIQNADNPSSVRFGTPTIAVPNAGAGSWFVSNATTPSGIVLLNPQGTLGASSVIYKYNTPTVGAWNALGTVYGAPNYTAATAILAGAAAEFSVYTAVLPPTITSFTPTSGAAGTTSITITGTNFNPSAPNDVYFGGRKVTANANAGGTSITVTVPNGTTSVTPITVKNNANNLQGSSLRSTTPYFTVTNTPNLIPAVTNYTQTTVNTGTNPRAVAVGDFNNDGFPDFATANNGSDNVSIRLGDGAGNFANTATVAAGTSPYYIVTEDINGDGNLDLAVANFGGAGNNVSILLGDGTGAFPTSNTFPLGATYLNPVAVALADFNNDGYMDFALAGTNGVPGGTSVRFGNGTGTSFTGTVDLASADPNAMVVGDFDNDGDIDIAVGEGNATNNLYIWTNNGAGGFTSTIFTIGTSAIQCMSVGRFNADANVDLMLGSSDNNVYFCAGNGAGSFTASATINLGTIPRGLATGDFNGDGNADVLIGSQIGGGQVAIGNGLGAFGTLTTLATAAAFGVAAGDFNNDGRTDFVSGLGAGSTATVSIYDPTKAFVTRWVTGNNQIIIPTTGGGYNYNISWRNLTNAGVGDGSITGQVGNYTITGLNNADTYEVRISGTFPRIFMNGGTEVGKLRRIDQWGNIAWTSMNNAFSGCSNLQIVATDVPNLAGVTTMQRMFAGCTALTGNASMNTWVTTTVTNMREVFNQASAFNQNISGWNTANVTNMVFMFSDATAFNNGGVSPMNWSTGSVLDMTQMFYNAAAFNQDISAWNTGNVTGMNGMFWGASSFNQNISGWNTSSVTVDMAFMFTDATAFNQNLGGWDVGGVTDMFNMLNNCGMSQTNYENTLIGWAAQSPSLQNGIDLGATGRIYCSPASVTARAVLTGTHTWNITGDALQCPFITTWITTDNTITIPTAGLGYNYNVSWTNLTNAGVGDGSATGQTGNYTTPAILQNGDTYQVRITGAFPRFFMNNNATERTKIRTIAQWGNIAWTSMNLAFSGCTNLTYTATDVPNLAGVTDLSYMFDKCTNFNGNATMNTWVTSTITRMDMMFSDADAFNQNISGWNTSNVTDMSGMFSLTNSFNQPVNTWVTSSVTNINGMFQGAIAFNQSLNTWITTNVTNMNGIFQGATSFNQPLNSWNVSNVFNMDNMFFNATSFNQPLNGWIPSSATNMNQMFQGATSFNQPLNSWNTTNVNSMTSMFSGATSFNQSLASWNIGNVADMTSMLDNTALSTANYEATLISWAAQAPSLQTFVPLGANGLRYCSAAAVTARALLTGGTYNWAITGDALLCPPPIITSFTPTSGIAGTSVTITGTGFNPSAPNDVYFGAIKVTANANAGGTSITVNVPAGAGSVFPITVKNNANNLQGSSITATTPLFRVTNTPNLTVNAGNYSKTDYTGANPYGITSADFNNDGNPDLAFTNGFGSGVSILLGNGIGGFPTNSSATTGTFPTAMVTADFNGDGNIDVATANQGSNTTSIRLGNGTGGFTSPGTPEIAVGANPEALAVGDFNNDGKIDLLVANRGDNDVSVLLGDGTGAFNSFGNVAVGNFPRSIAIGDFNGDGFQDFATANTNTNDVSIRLGNGIGGFSGSTSIPMGGGSGPYAVVVGDFNNDGNDDIAATTLFGGAVSISLGDGTGGFAAITSTVIGGNVAGISLGDFNGNGNIDLSYTVSNSIAAGILLGNGAGVMTSTATFTVGGSGPMNVVTGDFNKDGKADFATANNSGGNISVYLYKIPSPIITSFTPTSGVVGTSVTITGLNFNPSAPNDVYFGAVKVTANANAGGTSITVNVPAGATSVTPIVVRNNANSLQGSSMETVTGTTVRQFTVTNTPTITPNYVKTDFVVGGGPAGIVLKDFNGDGFADIATANPNADNVSVILGTGTGTFGAATNYAVGDEPFHGVASGDFNNDGNIDLAVPNYGTTNNVSVLLGTGTGTFGAATNFAVGTKPAHIAIGDFNDDGNLDLVTANSTSDNVSILLGTGTGTFGVATNFATNAGPWHVAVGDFNNDGNSDLAVSTLTVSGVSVLLGTGTGSFGAYTNFAVSIGPRAVEVGDFNNDGNLDLVTANYNVASASVILGTGTGSFGAPTNLIIGGSSFPQKVRVGDFNGDGNRDIVVSSYFTNLVSRFLGNGAGGFGTVTNFTVNGAPVGLEVADVNGDGKTDIVVANELGNNVSVLLYAAPPVITSFTPTSGAVGTSVTITGLNFNPSAANDVYFGAVKVTANANAGGTSITVNVPAGATSVTPIVVRNNANGLQGSSIETITGANARQFRVTNTPTLSITPTSYNQTDVNTANGPVYAATGDFDLDGDVDYIVSCSSGSVNVHLNNGSGIFGAATSIGISGVTLAGIATGDFNGDGDLDVAIADNGFARVYVYLGGAGSAFAFGSLITGISNPTDVGLGDFNGDGFLDVAIPRAGGVVSIRLGVGNGTFTAAADVTVGTNPQSIVVGDFDNNGITDFATTNNTNVNIRLGVGDGTFTAQPDVAVGTAPRSIAIGDFNNDGNQDLAVANNGSSNVSIRQGLGDGTFAGTEVAVGANPIHVTVADFNGDGNMDFATSDATGISIRLGAGGTFPTLTTIAGVTPNSLTVGNFNGDSATDILAPGGGTFVSVLLYKPTYYSRATGNWDVNTTWSFTSGGAAVTAGDLPIPAGANVVIEGGFTVTATANGQLNNVNLDINAANSTLDLAATTGHTINVFNSTGNGTLRLSSGTLPTVTTNTFMTVASTIVEYSGAANYNIPAQFSATNYQNLAISGTGVKTLLGATTVQNGLNLIAGRLQLGVFDLTYSGTEGNLTRTAGWIETDGAGTFTRNSIGVNFTFPVGNATQYQPLVIATPNNPSLVRFGTPTIPVPNAGAGSWFVDNGTTNSDIVLLNPQGTLNATSIVYKYNVPTAGTWNPLGTAFAVTDYTATAALTGVAAELSIYSCAAITIDATALPNGVESVAYNQTRAITGGTAPYSVAVSMGALPTGVTATILGNDVVISGTPTVNGTFNFDISVTDANGCIGTQTYTLQIDQITVSFADITAVNINENIFKANAQRIYAMDITATGGAPTLTDMSFTTGAGTYAAADVSNFRLYYNTINDFATATLIGTQPSATGNGETITFTGLTQVIAGGGIPQYLFIGADIPLGATTGNTIRIPSLSIANFTFTTAVNATASLGPSGTKTIANTAYYSRKTGVWSDNTMGNGTWSTIALGGASCDCLPTIGSDVFIAGADVVTADVATNTNSISLAGTLDLADFAHTVNIITDNGGAGILRIGGGTAAPTIAGATGSFFTTATNTVVFQGTVLYAIPNRNYPTLEIAGTGGRTLAGGSIDILGNLNASGGAAALTSTANINFPNAGILPHIMQGLAGGGQFNLNGGVTVNGDTELNVGAGPMLCTINGILTINAGATFTNNTPGFQVATATGNIAGIGTFINQNVLNYLSDITPTVTTFNVGIAPNTIIYQSGIAPPRNVIYDIIVLRDTRATTAGTITANAMTFDNAGTVAALNMVNNTIINVNGDLTLANATGSNLNFGIGNATVTVTGNLVAGTAGSIITHNAGLGATQILELQGATNTLNTFTNTTTAGTSIVRYNSAVAQQVFASPNYINLELLGGSNKTLSGNVTVSNALSLATNTVQLNANNLTYSGIEANLTRTTGWIITNGAGAFIRNAAGANFSFPVGNATNAQPVVISTPNNPASVRFGTPTLAVPNAGVGSWFVDNGTTTSDITLQNPQGGTLTWGTSQVALYTTVWTPQATTFPVTNNYTSNIAFTGATEIGVYSVGGTPFITTWTTTLPNETITIPTTGGGYNYNVNWGDASPNDTGVGGNITHTYVTPGTYTVSITGTFPRIFFNNVAPYKDQIRTIQQWGTNAWTSMANAFQGCTNLTYTATDVPNLAGVTDMGFMFDGCTAFNGNATMNTWNTATVTIMWFMFRGNTAFNANIGGWNTAAVTNMQSMFDNATAFNQNISTWNTAAVTNTIQMFRNATAFNQPIGAWNVSSVTLMGGMFSFANSFNQPLANWERTTPTVSTLANVTDMSTMFQSNNVFNQDISNWNTSGATNMFWMFLNNPVFNQPIGIWNTGLVTNMQEMFSGAAAFNQSLATWNMGAVTNATNMLNGSGLSVANYDATLIGWAAQTLQTGVNLGAAGLNYCAATTERSTTFPAKGWTVTDAGILCPPPVVTMTGIPALNIAENIYKTTNQRIYAMDISATGGTPTLTTMSFTTGGGTYVAADIANFKLYYNAVNNFATATLIGTQPSVTGNGETITFTGLTQLIAGGGVAQYLFIGADINAGAVTGNTIAIPVLTVANFTFAALVNPTATLGASGLKTIQPVPYFSRKTGNWSDATVGNGTWSLVAINGVSCDCTPIAGADVLIDPTHVITADVATNTTNIGLGGTLDLQNLTHTFGTLTNNGGAGILRIGGGTAAPTIAGATGTFFTTATNTVEFYSANTYNIPNRNYPNLTVNGASTKTLATGGAVNILGNLNVGTGATFNAVTNNVPITFPVGTHAILTDGTADLADVNVNGNTVLNNSGAYLNVAGNMAVATGISFTNQSTTFGVNFNTTTSQLSGLGTYINDTGAQMGYRSNTTPTIANFTATALNNGVLYDVGTAPPFNTTYYNLFLRDTRTTTAGTITANTIILDQINPRLNLATGSNIITTGNLSLINTNPILDFGTGTATVTVGGILNATAGTIIHAPAATFTQTLILNGANNVLGTFTNNPSAGTSIVRYSGANQTVFASANYENIEILGGGIKALAGAVTASGTLTLTNGRLQLGANDLTLSNAVVAAQIAGAPYTTSWVETDGTGSLIRQGFSTGMDFPVGDATAVRLVNMQISAAGNNTARFTATAPAITGTNPAAGMWVINRPAGNTGLSFSNVGGTADATSEIFSGGWLPTGTVVAGRPPYTTLAPIVFTGASQNFTVFTAVATTYYSAVASGAWNNAASWSTVCGGAGGAGIPTAIDNVVICAGNIINLTAAATCNNLTINATGTLETAAQNLTVNGTTTVDGTFQDSQDGGTNTFTGNVTVNAGGTFIGENAGGQINSPFVFGGNLTHSGTLFNLRTNTSTTFNGVNAVITANTNIDINFDFAGTVNFNANCSIAAGAGTLSFLAANSLVATGVIVTNNGSARFFYGNLNAAAASSTWINAANSKVELNGAALPMVGGIFTANAVNNTVRYARTAAQPILGGITYHHIEVYTNTKTINGGNIIVNGDLSILNAPVTTFDANNFNINIKGNWITGAGSTFVGGTGTVTFDGAAAQTLTGTTTFNNLTINQVPASTVTINSPITVTGQLALTNGRLQLGANDLTLSNAIVAAQLAGTPYTNSWVETNGTGNLIRQGATTGLDLPVGDATGVRLVNMVISGAGNNSARFVPTITPGIGGGTNPSAGMWVLNRPAGATSLTFSNVGGTANATALIHNGGWTPLVTTGGLPPYIATAFAFTGTPQNFAIFTPSPVVAPTTQSFNIQFSNLTANGLWVQWTNGNGANRIVVASTNPSPTPPTNNTGYTLGQVLGNGRVVYNGSGNLAVLSGLLPETQYYFQVFDYNGTGATTQYNLSAATNNPKSVTTLAIPPTNQPTVLVISNIKPDGATASFTPANPATTGYVAVLRRVTDQAVAPIDGQPLKVADIFFNGQVVIFVGNGNSFDISKLLPATEYVLEIYAYNGSGVSTVYKKDNPLSIKFTTASLLPVLTDLNISEKEVGQPGFVLQATGANFNKNSVLRWNNQVLTTTYVNENILQAAIAKELLLEAGIFPINVFNPPAGGGTSNALPFEVIRAMTIVGEPVISKTVPPGKDDHLLHSFAFDVAGGDIAFKALRLLTTGNYRATDLKDNAFTLKYSTDANLDNGDITIGTARRVAANGSLVFDYERSPNPPSLPKGKVSYLLLTVNIATDAVSGNQIGIAATDFDNIELVGKVVKKGKNPVVAGTMQKIIFVNPTPQDYSELVRFFNEMGGQNWATPWNLNAPVNTWKGVELDEDGKVIAINLRQNNLAGKISDAFMGNGSLIGKNLKYLNLSDNKIVGQIPANIRNLTGLEYLDLSKNQLDGKVSKDIESLSSLVTLWLGYNQLNEIDIDFSKLPKLRNLFLQFNNFEKLPESIGELGNLEVFTIKGNKFKSLPSGIGRLRKLKFLDISDNELNIVPQGIENLADLETLLMHENLFRAIPRQLLNLQNLRELTVYDNYLEFGELEPLRSWWSGANRINITYFPQARLSRPQELTISVGSAFSLPLTATGSQNRYQWFKNGRAIPNGTSATLSFPSFTTDDAAIYLLQVTSPLVPLLTLQSYEIVLIADCGKVSSTKPKINILGASVFCGRESVNTRLNVDDIPNIQSYKWYFNGIEISNSNQNNFLVDKAGRYTVQLFSKDGCSLFADEITISILPEYSVSITQNQGVLQAVVEGREISSYEWLLNGNTIPSATQRTFTPLERGNYTVRVTDRNGCRAQALVPVAISSVTAVEDADYSRDFKLYPNPFETIFKIEFGTEKVKSVQVFNALGKLFNEKIISLGDKTLQIDLSSQANGIYFVEITTDKGKIIRKVVKQ